MDVGQQQRSFYAPSTGRDLGHGVVTAGMFVPHGEGRDELYCLLTHSIAFLNSLGSTLFPSARILRTCWIKWNGVSAIWTFVMLCQRGRRSTLGKICIDRFAAYLWLKKTFSPFTATFKTRPKLMLKVQQEYNHTLSRRNRTMPRTMKLSNRENVHGDIHCYCQQQQ